MAVLFRVQHLNHSGGVVSTHTPVGGSLHWAFKANDMGDISYTLPLSDTAIGRDSFAPYFTDWRLQQKVDTNAWESIAAGIHVPVNMVSDEDTVHVAGKDWAHWLEQPPWFPDFSDLNFSPKVFKSAFKDYNEPLSRTEPSGFVNTPIAKAWYPPAIQQDVIQWLVENLRRGTDYVNITTAFNGTGWSEVTDLKIIIFQDETKILDHINEIASMDAPYGFDWTMNWNKQMEFFGPRKQVATSPTPIWTINETMILNPVDMLDWTNNGPIGTVIMGLGPASPGIWRIKKDQQSIDRYRLWNVLERVGGPFLFKTKGQIRYLTDGLQYMAPQKDLKVTIRPEDIDPFTGFKNQIGEVVHISWDFPPYHQIDAYYWIVGQDFSSDAPGNFKCDLSLQQIYG